jgi:UDP-glucose 4-epimerase
MDDVCGGAEVVFHQAALASVQRSVENPLATNRVNVEGTMQVLECARRSSIRRVVCASSSSIYGDSPVLPKEESMPLAPKSPYATSKTAGELYARNYAELFEVETVSLRYFNVFGPHQDPESQYAAVIPIFITHLLNEECPTIFGDGEQSRDFTFVENVVEANLLAATAEGASGRTFNIGCGERYTLNQLLDLLREIIGSDVEAIYADPRPGDVRHSQAQIQRARDVLGYTPSVAFREGLRRTVEWYSERLDPMTGE